MFRGEDLSDADGEGQRGSTHALRKKNQEKLKI